MVPRIPDACTESIVHLPGSMVTRCIIGWLAGNNTRGWRYRCYNISWFIRQIPTYILPTTPYGLARSCLKSWDTIRTFVMAIAAWRIQNTFPYAIVRRGMLVGRCIWRLSDRRTWWWLRSVSGGIVETILVFYEFIGAPPWIKSVLPQNDACGWGVRVFSCWRICWKQIAQEA